MSTTVDKLSLLGALAPLRQRSDISAVRQEKGFAEKLDDALGSGAATASGAAGSPRELAESLTLQMLQSSLTLAGDPSPDISVPARPAASSAAADILRAYRANLSAGAQAGESAVLPPSQLRELASEDTPTSPVTAASPLPAETAWLEPIISKASRKYGVDVGLIRAVIKAESDFNPQAVSHAGARGLMQLMPATARSLGVSDAFDPEQNVMGGTRFLKDMLQRYGGDVDSALAAYNWGPGNVDRHPDRLPRETRNYLARVKQLYVSYSG